MTTRRLDHNHKPEVAAGILATCGVELCRCGAYRVKGGAWVLPHHHRRYWGRRMPS